MDPAALYVASTDLFLATTAMTHEMAHLHGGLAIYIVVQFLLRTRRASAIALQAVYGAEIVNEIMQRAFYGSWRWEDTTRDLLITVFWPSVLYLMASWRRQRWSRRQARSVQAADMMQVSG